MTQPHHIFGPTLREQIDQLIAETELAKKTLTKSDEAISLIDQYTHQISKWTTSMTALQRQRTYTLGEIIALAGLSGHFRPRASNQFTGEALRRCGFESKRNWTNTGRNKRYWKLKKETL